MITSIYLGPIPEATLVYLNRVNRYFPVGLISDRDYECLNIDFHVNINSQLAINTLGSIGIDFDIIRKRPYKLCDWKPFWFMIFDKLGADLSRGFGYFDLDLMFSRAFLQNLHDFNNVVLLTGIGSQDFGHFRFYSCSVDKLYESFILTSKLRDKLNARYSYAFDESHVVRSINAGMSTRSVQGFDQSIYHTSLFNNLLSTKHYRIKLSEDNIIVDDDILFDYFHCQKRGYLAGDNLCLVMSHSKLNGILVIVKIIYRRIKAKLLYERRY